jgi:triphosphoribosyl-dephospho-CoA synthase
MREGPGTEPGFLAEAACILECSAPKAGNVHKARDFADATYEEFIASAKAIAAAMSRARSNGVGWTVLEAVKRTRWAVGKNTNLGIILLLSPLAAVDPECSDFKKGVQEVLDRLSVEDCKLAYEAIRLANPGGLGSTTEQDVRSQPEISLLEAMKIAADRDLIAYEYASGYRNVFDFASPAIGQRLEQCGSIETAIVGAHLQLMACLPDSLIARKRGRAEAELAASRAKRVLDLGWPDVRAKEAFEEFDHWLRSEGSSRNPGATADLIAAALYVLLKKGRVAPPSLIPTPTM